MKLVGRIARSQNLYSFIPTQPEPGPFLSDSCTCNFWTPGGATDNTAQTRKLLWADLGPFIALLLKIVIFQMKAFRNQKPCGVEE